MKNITSSIEDYLETILLLGGDKQGVKSVAIAKQLNVSKPAVTLATNNLLENNFIEKASYGEIKLTAEGATIARNCLEKRTFIKNFLLGIGVTEETAEKECCKMEHHLHDETIECLKKFCASHDINIWIENNEKQ